MNSTDEIDNILNSLDHLKRAEAPADFRKRLTDRLAFMPQPQAWTSKTKFALAAMITMALLNGAILYTQLSTTSQESDSMELVDLFHYETSLYE